jgi:uncharacterized NAD(P)/FAD-binding protein YdhS
LTGGDHVAIVGAGFSGTMLAVQLLQRGGGRVTLIERGPEAGRGLAYGAADPIHLLNVCAAGMSAFPDRPDDFARFAQASGWAASGTGFAPRRLYGDYLQARMKDAAAAAGGRFTLLRHAARDIRGDDERLVLALDDGLELGCDSAVLALGNPPPAAPPGIDSEALGADIYRADPWAAGATDGLGPDDPVLIIGTGLTMIDMALLLERSGSKGPILALSRRGLMPRPHAEPVSYEARSQAPRARGAALLQAFRHRADAIGWRQAVDELRPFTQNMWRRAPNNERRRFLRHLRPWWDVHRHRLAPQLHARIMAMVESGRLEVAAGKLLGAKRSDGRAQVRWRRRGSDVVECFAAARIINCTGPEGLLRNSSEPLLRNLAARGAVRPGSCGIGLDVDEAARVIDGEGQANPRLFALGPLTRGTFWEISAVPDIRLQVEALAVRLTA